MTYTVSSGTLNLTQLNSTFIQSFNTFKLISVFTIVGVIYFNILFALTENRGRRLSELVSSDTILSNPHFVMLSTVIVQ